MALSTKLRADGEQGSLLSSFRESPNLRLEEVEIHRFVPSIEHYFERLSWANALVFHVVQLTLHTPTVLKFPLLVSSAPRTETTSP